MNEINVPTFKITGHAEMHDCYFVADMPPLQTLVAEYGLLGARIHNIFSRLYSVQAQHYAQLQARIGVRMTIKLLLQALSANDVAKEKYKGQKKAIVSFKDIEDLNIKQEGK